MLDPIPARRLFTGSGAYLDRSAVELPPEADEVATAKAVFDTPVTPNRNAMELGVYSFAGTGTERRRGQGIDPADRHRNIVREMELADEATPFLGGPFNIQGRVRSKIAWRQAAVWALTAFFVAGSLSNIFAPRSIIEEYVRWGYPHWFHFVTGTLELTAVVLLVRVPTRLWGAALGCTVMCAALGTVVVHGEYGHAAPPLIVAGLAIVVGWIAWRQRRTSPA